MIQKSRCCWFASRLIILYFFIPDALPNSTRRNGSGPYSDFAGYRMSAYKKYEETLPGHEGFRV